MPKITSGRVASGTGTVSFDAAPNAPLWGTPEGLIAVLLGGHEFRFKLVCTPPPETGPLYFTIVAGNLPPGLTLDSDGSIKGTAPQSDNQYNFTVRAINEVGLSERNFTLNVQAEPPIWYTPQGPLTQPLDAATTVSVHLDARFTDGTPAFVRIAEGTLPVGLTLDPLSAMITGAAPALTSDTTYDFIAEAYGEQGGVAPRAFSFTVLAQAFSPVWVTPAGMVATLPMGQSVVNLALLATSNAGLAISYMLSEGALPDGLNLDDVSGSLRGAPDDVPADSLALFTVEASDGKSPPTPRDFAILVTHVNSQPVWTTDAGPLGTANTERVFSFVLGATDADQGPQPLHFALDPTSSLPAGLTLTPDGVIIGLAALPESQGNSFTAIVDDGLAFVPRDFVLDVTTSSLYWISPGGTLGTYLCGQPMVFALAYGSTAPYMITVELIGGALPPGLSMTSDGVISGVPALVDLSATTSFTLRLDDGQGHPVDQQFSLTIRQANRPPVWKTHQGVIGNISMGKRLSIRLQATDPDYDLIAYGLALGQTLPAGLAIDRVTGIVGGTPGPVVLDQPATFIARADDQHGGTADRSFVLNIKTANRAPVWVTPAGTLTTATPSTPMLPLDLLAVDPDGDSVGYVQTAGTLPPGLVLSLFGKVVGTPRPVIHPTHFSFTVAATDGRGGVTKQDFDIFVPFVNRAPVWLTPAGSIGSFPMSQDIGLFQFSALDPEGEQPIYALVDGSLPSALSFEPVRGVLSGVPDVVFADQTYSFVVTAADREGNITPRGFALTVQHVNRAPVWTTPSMLLGTFTMGSQITPIVVTATDPDFDPVSYGLAAGSLDGLDLDARSGTISGTPGPVLHDTTFGISILASDNHKGATPQGFGYVVKHVNRPPVWRTVAGYLGSLVMLVTMAPITLNAIDPDGDPVSYAVTGGSFPAGLTLDPNGVVYGAPDAVLTDERATFTATATDTFGASASIDLVLALKHVNRPPVWHTPDNLGTYPMQVSIPPITLDVTDADFDVLKFDLAGGTLPPGLLLTRDGTIYGPPEANLVDTRFTFTMTADDKIGVPVPRTMSMTIRHVNRPPVWRTPGNLGGYTMGVTVGPLPLQAVDPDGNPVGYVFTGGTLPSGLVYTDNGTLPPVIAGTPDVVLVDTPSTFTISAGDTFGAMAPRDFTLTVIHQNRPPVWNTQGSLGTFPMTTPIPLVGLSTTDPDGDQVKYAVIDGNLPSGLSFNSGGSISGTPDAVQVDTTSSLTVVAYDIHGGTTPQALTITVAHVNRPPVWTTTPGLLGTAYIGSLLPPIQLATTDADFDVVRYSLDANSSLAPGLTLSLDGQITGTPVEQPDNFNDFTVNVYDPHGGTTPQAFTVLVKHVYYPPIWRIGSDLGTYPMTVASIAIPMTATDPLGAAVHYSTSDILPGGLGLSSDGLLSGSPTPVLIDTTGTFVIDATSIRNEVQPATFILTILHVNRAPTWNTPAELGTYTANHSITPIPLSLTDLDFDPVSLTFTGGSLPAGLSFSAGVPGSLVGSIYGTLPPITLTYDSTFTITADDGHGGIVPRNFHISTNNAPTWDHAVAGTITLPLMTFNQPYRGVASASDGDGPLPLLYSLGTGQLLPTGISLDTASGTIFGTATEIGGPQFAHSELTYALSATDGAATITVLVVIPVSPLPTAWDNFTGFAQTGAAIVPSTYPVSLLLDAAPLSSTWDNMARFASTGVNLATGTTSVRAVNASAPLASTWDRFGSFSPTTASLRTGSVGVSVQAATAPPASTWDNFATFSMTPRSIVQGTGGVSVVAATLPPANAWDNFGTFAQAAASLTVASAPISAIVGGSAPPSSAWDSFGSFTTASASLSPAGTFTQALPASAWDNFASFAITAPTIGLGTMVSAPLASDLATSTWDNFSGF